MTVLQRHIDPNSMPHTGVQCHIQTPCAFRMCGSVCHVCNVSCVCVCQSCTCESDSTSHCLESKPWASGGIRAMSWHAWANSRTTGSPNPPSPMYLKHCMQTAYWMNECIAATYRALSRRMQQCQLHSDQWCNHWRWTSTWPLTTYAPLLCCGTCVPSAPALLIVAKVLSTELAMIHCDTSHTTTGSYQATPSDMKVVGKWKHGIGSASTGLHISSTEAVCGQFSHSSVIR